MTIQFVAKNERPHRSKFSDLRVGDWYTTEDNNGCRVYVKISPTHAFEPDAMLTDLLIPYQDLLVYQRTVKLLVEKL